LNFYYTASIALVYHSAMDGRLPLPTLLSHALVAFTIEFDNEFERQMPHRTTDHGSTPGSHDVPWLVSMVMWTKFMRFIRDDGVTAGELRRLLRIADKDLLAWLTRLGKWWGYLVVEPDLAASGSKRIPDNAVVRPTAAGRKAQAVWRPLTAIIEKRWQERFGKAEIGHLRESLRAVAGQLDAGLPDCLPILGYGLFSGEPDSKPLPLDEAGPDSVSRLSLPALLSRTLLAFAIEFERDSKVSLAICANVLRILGDQGARVRDLPRLAAVSKEAIATSLSFLEKQGYTVVETESRGSKIKVAVLTAKGRRARDAYHQLVWVIEERWQARFGKGTMRGLWEWLEQLVGQPTAQLSPLFRGLEPYPDGWRASVPRPDGLPHFPMVLHRGGFPDGS